MRVKGNFEMFELYGSFYKISSLRKYFDKKFDGESNVFEYEKFYEEMKKLRNLVPK
jgi:hypothetical protein